jgi:hypothetical protein
VLRPERGNRLSVQRALALNRQTVFPVLSTPYKSANPQRSADSASATIARGGDSQSVHDVSRAELRVLLDDPLSRAADYAAGAFVIAILAFIVFKP